MTPTAVNLWVQRYRARGEAALAARKQGLPRHPSLSDEQVAETTQLMRDQAPEQLELPYVLWTREAVGELIQRQWGIRLSRSTVGRYLRAWGYSRKSRPNEPGSSALKPSEAGWTTTTLPCTGGLSGKALKFTLGDEMGLRSDHQTGTCWAPKG